MVSAAIAALGRTLGCPEGRAKLRPRQSGRDETVTNPDVRIGATSTDASSASTDVSQSVETRRLRTGMAPRFSNVTIRGSLAGVRRDGFLPGRFANSRAGRVNPTDSHIILCLDVRGDSKISDGRYTTSKS